MVCEEGYEHLSYVGNYLSSVGARFAVLSDNEPLSSDAERRRISSRIVAARCHLL